MDTFYLMENLPFIFIIVFLIVVVTLLLVDRSNILQISEKQNSLKDKLNDIKIPECPQCPEQKECPSFTCPEQKECPSLTCPETPQCPKCPEHPGIDIPTCPECPKCPEKEECPECPKNEDCPECPKCPDCPNSSNTSPSAQEIADAIFPGRQDSNVLSGNYLPSDQFFTNNINVANNNTMNSPRPVMETLPGFLPYADDSVSLGNYFPISQIGLSTDSASGTHSHMSHTEAMDMSSNMNASDVMSTQSNTQSTMGNTTQLQSLSTAQPTSPPVSQPSSPRSNMN